MPFPPALAFVLRWEGGYVNNPADHGGATNHGITQRTYTDWLARHGRPDADVRGIPDADVQAIYLTDYWQPVASQCSEPLATAVFDGCVNHGLREAVRLLQQACRDRGDLCDVDGIWGPNTAGSVARCDPHALCRVFLDRREALYRQLATRPGQGQFLAGWLARLSDLRRVTETP